MNDFTPTHHPDARVVRVDVNHTDPVHAARTLRGQPDTRPVYLLIDCRDVTCLRTHGVCHFVSRLLLVRRLGVAVLLHNVTPRFGRALQLLHTDCLFDIIEPEYQALPPAA